MSELGDRMALIIDALREAVPGRIVTRDLKDFAQRDRAELTEGVYTVLSQGERDYANYPGRAGMDARQTIVLIGQQVLAENVLPSEIEDAEFEMLDDIKDFLRNLPSTLCRLEIRSFRQSQQVDHPYAWIAVELEYIP